MYIYILFRMLFQSFFSFAFFNHFFPLFVTQTLKFANIIILIVRLHVRILHTQYIRIQLTFILSHIFLYIHFIYFSCIQLKLKLIQKRVILGAYFLTCAFYTIFLMYKTFQYFLFFASVSRKLQNSIPHITKMELKIFKRKYFVQCFSRYSIV